MFAVNRIFNQDIGLWDVRNVSDMEKLFYETDNFNQDISNWDVSNVYRMERMFDDAISFNQNLSTWNVDNVTTCIDFSNGASSWSLPQPNLLTVLLNPLKYNPFFFRVFKRYYLIIVPFFCVYFLLFTASFTASFSHNYCQFLCIFDF